MFKIIIPVYNSEKWIGKCIDSIKTQSHREFQCIVIDDNSKDQTFQRAKESIGTDKRFVLMRNKVRKLAMENRINGIKYSQPSDEDVIVDIDGDDWLHNEHSLWKIFETYNNTNCLVTYGNWVEHPSGKIGFCSAYSYSVIDNNGFREDEWRCSMPRTYKYKLWKRILDKDFRNPQGEYYKIACDPAMMYPLLEMAGHRHRFISDILYVYNRTNPINDYKVNRNLQRYRYLEISSKEKYRKIPDTETLIPKIMHQMWIGPRPPPTKLMKSWKAAHPDFEYILWTESEIKKRNMSFSCQNRIDEIEEIVGKVDIMRWEILYKYGGIFIDADSVCINRLDEKIINQNSFASWENEEVIPGLIAVGTMGFPPKNPMVEKAIEYISNNKVSKKETGKDPWQVTGPELLTKVWLESPKSNCIKFKIFPSYLFLPVHHTGLEYSGSGKIYAFQEWASTNDSDSVGYGGYASYNIEKVQNRYKDNHVSSHEEKKQT